MIWETPTYSTTRDTVPSHASTHGTVPSLMVQYSTTHGTVPLMVQYRSHTGEADEDGSYLEPYYSWYSTITRKRIQPPLNTPEPYRPSGHEHYLLVASLVRTCKMSVSMFFKTTDKEVKGQLHDMFHATHANLLKIGEGRALDVDVTQIHLLSDSDEDLDLPHDTYDVGLLK